MKSERHAERMALFCASLGACAKALVADAKSAAANNACRVDACFKMLDIWINSRPVGNADAQLKPMQTIITGDAARKSSGALATTASK
ncbi:hypothetical protein [Bradyrhizobium sp. Gha]|uniref:hypothetical protein n=1 Tax=Bradyrhizobium sp. Gha TaxID=1855318 RepID=UPI0008EB9055|nr:hypothetical protein [Bradyrhizobium sp. Gha]SFJ31985.1 hypothetical protein SAMN05216525_12275 [Bradyrhizobium sp. Gha]